MTTSYIGIDLHRTVIQICVLDRGGQIIPEKRAQYGTLEEGLLIVEFLRSFGPGTRVAVEALGLNRWFVNACQDVGLDVLVCDPRKLVLKMLGRKTDLRDAREIARRLWLGDLDRMATTYYPSDQEYGRRKLLRIRHKLVQLRQQTINQMRALMSAYQIPSPKGVLYTGPSQARLAEIAMPVDELQLAFDALRHVLASIQDQIKILTGRIRKLPRVDDDVALLEQCLPGIGAQSAATLLAELGDVNRFPTPRAVAAYAGLVPKISQSADKAHHGRLTKQGNPELRWILSQWAVRLLKDNEVARRWEQNLRKRVHKNKARMALARRLLVGVWVMLTRGEAFDLDRCLGMTA